MAWDWDFPDYDNDWRKVAALCKRRDKHRCTKCGCKGSKENPLHASHIVSKRHGGKDALHNLKTLCAKCHSQEPGHYHMRKKYGTVKKRKKRSYC